MFLTVLKFPTELGYCTDCSLTELILTVLIVCLLNSVTVLCFLLYGLLSYWTRSYCIDCFLTEVCYCTDVSYCIDSFLTELVLTVQVFLAERRYCTDFLFLYSDCLPTGIVLTVLIVFSLYPFLG